MDEWTWRYEGAGTVVLDSAALPNTSFPSQADAESWVGETWRELLTQGVEAVTLLHDGVAVYGPMSLRPVE